MPSTPTNAPPDQPGQPIVYGKFDGLKNTIEAERLGPRDLTRAQNIVLDDAGEASRRRGYTLQLSGNAHGLFTASQGSPTLVVYNGALGLLNPNFTFTSLGWTINTDPGLGLEPLAYTQVGRSAYFSSPVDRGIVNLDALTVSTWGSGEDYWLSPVVNPTATLPAVAGRLLRQPPNATSLAYYRGRILLAQGTTLWATMPYLYNYVDVNRGFKQMNGQITMVGAVSDGVYVGTDEGLYWLSGEGFDMWKMDRVMDSAVIPGSMTIIPGELGNPPQISLDAATPIQVSLMFLTQNGVNVAGDGGQTTNITENKFFFPQAQRATTFYRRQDGLNQFVSVLQSGGDPVANAAIGDFCEATIIRAAEVQNPFVKTAQDG